jgi:hypothetical protein
MRLPGGPADGAVARDRVIETLRLADVDVQHRGDNRYRLKRGTNLLMTRFNDPVYRDIVRWLARTFEINPFDFYEQFDSDTDDE